MLPVVTLKVASNSDGTGATPAAGQDLVRNDEYYLEKIATRWMQDEGRKQANAVYRLDRLPPGFSGYEKQRQGSKQIDRWMYGHPNGVFRSLNELYPHFKHLQDHGGSPECACKLCNIRRASSSGRSEPIISSRARTSHFFVAAGQQPLPSVHRVEDASQRPNPDMPHGRLGSDSSPTRSRQVDGDGTPDVYRALLDKLQEAGPDVAVEEILTDYTSPDWRAGHKMLQILLEEWKQLPGFVPRVGELVLFSRKISEEMIAWDAASRSLRRRQNGTWLGNVEWEVGVVTQMPQQSVSIADLTGISPTQQNVTQSGFRIEPLSEPGSQSKLFTKQHKYVPFHAIRPFSFWKDCLGGKEDEWHPTVKHALTVASSFCVIGRYKFKGIWPSATVFASGIYIGPELVMVGDLVRLLPADPKSKFVTDVMQITSIRLRFVNLERASDDDYDDCRPYTICLHVAGRGFTLDPKRSFNGIAKAPVKAGEGLPAGLAGYGQWFHIVDPGDEKARLELPFNRILGRCFDDIAIRAWFAAPNDLAQEHSFQAGTFRGGGKATVCDLSQGLSAIQEARSYSRKADRRINREHHQSWHWAESRIEQLDLHEVNGHFVGAKEEARTKKQVKAWHKALEVLDGKRGRLGKQHIAKKPQEVREPEGTLQAPSASWGKMWSAMQAESDEDELSDDEKEEEEEEQEEESSLMDIDQNALGHSNTVNAAGVIDLTGSDGEPMAD